MIRLSPWPSPGELKKYYPESYWFAPGATTASRLEEFYRRLVLRDHVNFVAAALKTQERGPVLDIGCGGALFGKLLRDRGYPCFGLDFSQTAATVGWSTNKVPVALGDFKLAPFREGSFGAVTMFHVLEHLYDPLDALSAVHKLLRPGGCLIVQVPNAACWQFLLFGEAWNGIDVPRHLVDFKARDLDTMLARSGFELVRHKYFSLRDNPAGLASTLAPGLDPMARRIRRPNEGPRSKLLRDLLYLGLVGVAVPFTLLEAACQAGSTVMVEARKKGA
ncbi:MAG: class I SAM-dependent methyltransferase [Bryobacteraceae bacterium]|nr:class I SAM-dependent methyltransferase [Bryobacteraceae bacterium]